MSVITDLEARLGLVFQDFQLAALAQGQAQDGPRQRRCLYYRTGAGKTVTALSLMAVWGRQDVLVVAPPSTQAGWIVWGKEAGVNVVAISHAKFRRKDYKLDRNTAVIVDEFHLLGGHAGQGWKKLDRLAAGLNAPLLILSATPNYNDAERVYCVQHVLDPASCRGGFIEFLYTHCDTKQNMFSQIPDVEGFKNFPEAKDYLAALPNVDYLPDDLEYDIQDISYSAPMPDEYETYGFNRRKFRLVASDIEDRHTRRYQGLVKPNGFVGSHVMNLIDAHVDYAKPLLVFANHATVAKAVHIMFLDEGAAAALVTGDTSAKNKDAEIQRFIEGSVDILVGTASLATGTDGMDKICDQLMIVDDTDDDSLRRQLVGRIMPRGLDTDASQKKIFRLVPHS